MTKAERMKPSMQRRRTSRNIARSVSKATRAGDFWCMVWDVLVVFSRFALEPVFMRLRCLSWVNYTAPLPLCQKNLLIILKT